MGHDNGLALPNFTDTRQYSLALAGKTREPGFAVSQRMETVQSPIISLIGDLIRAHPGTISLGQGVAYYGPPTEAVERIALFGKNPNNHLYGPVQGEPQLIALIRKKLQEENGIDCAQGYRIVVTAGANMAFLAALFAITDPGDEVILPIPYYFNQEMALRMLSCVPVLVETDENFHPRLDRIAAALSPRTRAIVTISPNNPSGAVYPERFLRAVNALCRERGIYHITDEAYEYFTFGTANHFSPGSIPDASQHTISLYSLSKAYGFASWRIGYGVIPEHLYEAVLKAQDTNLICPPVISQHAAIGALEVGSDYCREKLKVTGEIREVLFNDLGTVGSYCQLFPAQGAFYALLAVETRLTAMQLARKLITEHGVAIIPGTAFGLETGCHFRIAYGALQKEPATEAIGRLVTGLKHVVGGDLPP